MISGAQTHLQEGPQAIFGVLQGNAAHLASGIEAVLAETGASPEWMIGRSAGVLNLGSACPTYSTVHGMLLGEDSSRAGFRRALSTVYSRAELLGTIAASSPGHRTVNGFHAHGGTAITLNLRRPGSAARSGRSAQTSVWPVPAMPREPLSSHAVAGTELRPVREVLMWVNFADRDSVRPPIEVPQPILLRTLIDAAAVHPHFMLVRPAGATDLLRSGGKVTGVSARTPDGVVEVSARLTAGAGGRYGDVPGLAVRKLPIRPSGIFTTVVLKRHVPGILMTPASREVDRSRGLQPRHEKMFTWSAPPARAPRRTFCRMIGNNPRLKRCVWRGLYRLVPPRAGPARLPVRST